jgi:thiosulfate/3-mercaptopyruvate sulfurtransferase
MTQHLLDAAALAARLDDGHTLVVDCRADLLDYSWGLRQFEAGHIPGAVYAGLNTDLSGPAGPTTGRHPLPSPQQFAATLARWGVTPDTRVVGYDQGPGPYAARLWWLLRAVGYTDVQVLDGGWAAWSAAGLPVQTGAAPVRAPSVVAARECAGWVDADTVLASLRSHSACVVDARGADRFAGQNETIDPVAGHIPGAVNYPFTANLGSDGRFKSPQLLREQWLARLGTFAPAQLIASCGSGITACHNLLALSQAGLDGGRLYAGSWSHWIRDPQRPIATGPEPGSP